MDLELSCSFHEVITLELNSKIYRYGCSILTNATGLSTSHKNDSCKQTCRLSWTILGKTRESVLLPWCSSYVLLSAFQIYFHFPKLFPVSKIYFQFPNLFPISKSISNLSIKSHWFPFFDKFSKSTRSVKKSSKFCRNQIRISSVVPVHLH